MKISTGTSKTWKASAAADSELDAAIRRHFEATIASLKADGASHNAAAGQLALEALLSQHYDGDEIQCSVNAAKESNALREAATATGYYLALQYIEALQRDVLAALAFYPVRVVNA